MSFLPNTVGANSHRVFTRHDGRRDRRLRSPTSVTGEQTRLIIQTVKRELAEDAQMEFLAAHGRYPPWVEDGLWMLFFLMALAALFLVSSFLEETKPYLFGAMGAAFLGSVARKFSRAMDETNNRITQSMDEITHGMDEMNNQIDYLRSDMLRLADEAAARQTDAYFKAVENRLDYQHTMLTYHTMPPNRK